jgi:hypothetical protein
LHENKEDRKWQCKKVKKEEFKKEKKLRAVS